MKFTAKRILASHESAPKVFLDLVCKFIEEHERQLSSRDLTKIALGAAMSVADKTPDPMRVKELLDVIRDWTQGRAFDEDLEIAKQWLWDLYQIAAHTLSGRRTLVALARAHWAIFDALEVGAHPQEIIDSIEKETGPLDWFLASRSLKRTG